jgi:hypothetical protein
MKKPKPTYVWICDECARRNGGKWPEGHLGTFHEDHCGWCKEWKVVTEPRDYRGVRWPGK